MLGRALELLQALLDTASPEDIIAQLPYSLPLLGRLVQAHAAYAAAAQSDDWEAEEHMGTDQRLPTEAGATHALNCLDVVPPLRALPSLVLLEQGSFKHAWICPVPYFKACLDGTRCMQSVNIQLCM